MSYLSSLTKDSFERYTKYTCPICNKKKDFDDYEIFSQRDKLLGRSKKVVSGSLGKQYIKTTEHYSVNNIKICKDCNKKINKKSRILFYVCFFVLPILSIIYKILNQNSDESLVGSIFGGIIVGLVFGFILMILGALIIIPKIDVLDAKKKNAVLN